MKKVDLVEWRVLRSKISDELSIGFVPTMGDLHLGHQSLLETSVHQNDVTVLSIYVNPTQFNNADDFAAYPSMLEQDFDLAQKCGVDYVILPTYEQLYADGFVYRVDEFQNSLKLEGEKRPGHYQGVLTVVMKLLNCVQPDCLYMGEKDFQQYELVAGMVQAFFMRVKVVLCPTVREKSGLALSSRNHRLSDQARQKAAVLFRSLSLLDCSADEVALHLQNEGIEVGYVEDYQSRRFAAVTIDGVRLIDNVLLSEGEKLC
jgi:pantoate--beta-alanine ligase